MTTSSEKDCSQQVEHMQVPWHATPVANSILRSCELSEGNGFVFMENPREGMCQGKDIFT